MNWAKKDFDNLEKMTRAVMEMVEHQREAIALSRRALDMATPQVFPFEEISSQRFDQNVTTCVGALVTNMSHDDTLRPRVIAEKAFMVAEEIELLYQERREAYLKKRDEREKEEAELNQIKRIWTERPKGTAEQNVFEQAIRKNAKQEIVLVTCDRCQQVVTGVRAEGGEEVKHTGQSPRMTNSWTGGYYETGEGYWARFADAGEKIICDACMFRDPRYIAAYGRQR
jgi:hypothetical protein